ncbi:O-methyltransferase [Cephaloticoccus primus]|uniref:O-methyltransferase n=1 Tax=Cephaloticoccus primus TaxID=1548207 RepID=UPI0012E7CCE3|nr:O-methyltransferase [Cephaloticoccus primus]
MKSLPYHLRSNKSVDRYLFVEVIKRVISLGASSEDYGYVGFGGPFLEDLKIIDHYFPEMKLTSIEEKSEVVKRQRYHRFRRGIQLLKATDQEFVDSLEDEALLVFWLDYMGCEPRNFEVFSNAIKKAANWSVLRITLNASFTDRKEFKESFFKDFEQILPANAESYFENENRYLLLLQQMLRIATTPPPMADYDFRLLSSVSYRDGRRMLTITGLKCADADWSKVEQVFSRWPFFTEGWSAIPTRVNVPDLSLQERNRLASRLPSSKNVGHQLHKCLGYSVAGDTVASITDLENYAAFSRYFPTFAKLAI